MSIDSPARPDVRSPRGGAPEPVTDEEAPTALLAPGWPLTIAFVGIPLWWVLGLFQVVFFLACIPMVIQLTQRRVMVPRGFGTWLLFLVWVIGGIFVLQVDAPATIPGEGASRYFTFGYRYGWYLAATIAFLYTVNMRAELSTLRISRAIGWMFVMLASGGILGLLVPTLEFPSVAELLLPGAIANNGFVQSLIHPQVAQLQDFLGYVEPRPSAPFAYANQWGIATAATIPHFVASWWVGNTWRRWVVIIGLPLAIFPIVGSLNRGMWGALVMMTLFVIVKVALTGRLQVLWASLVVVILIGAALVVSPLGDLILDRLNTPHSNEGRANLSTQAVVSTWQGSPFVGYGSTRDVQGNFNSIATGASALCPNCSPPPLGTQGQLWQVVFATGFVGAALYVGFIVGQFFRSLRRSTVIMVAAQASTVAALVTMPVYTVIHPAIVVIFISLGLLVRENPGAHLRPLNSLIVPPRRNVATVLVLTVVGALAGAGLQLTKERPYAATLSVLLSNTSLVNAPQARPFTLDTEAQLATSRVVLDAVAQATGIPGGADETRERILITAEPNTRILNLTFYHPDREAAVAGAREGANRYLDLRLSMAEEASSERAEDLQNYQEALAESVSLTSGVVETDEPTGPEAEDEEEPLVFGALQGTLIDLRREYAQVSSTWLGLQRESVNPGQEFNDVTVTRSQDPWFVYLTSGAMLGLFAGLLVARATDGRRDRLGQDPAERLDLGVPVVGRVGVTASGGFAAAELEEAAWVARTYTPLAGIFPVTTSMVAVDLAEQLDRALRGPVDRRGERVLLVATSDSAARPVRRLYREATAMGLQPVGLLLVDWSERTAEASTASRGRTP
ncbi:hypothetical protein [Serinicoccus sp. CUA-874]|uniref:hypothetical protein n=1 Tax=Serinicoccus sp. CUA-874 TaxID=1517939 RepID=UPI001179ABDD|nr:hypothetical protein [Serinicoccus sp. CUA-874]